MAIVINRTGIWTVRIRTIAKIPIQGHVYLFAYRGSRFAIEIEIIRSIDKVFIFQRHSKVFYDGKAAFV